MSLFHLFHLFIDWSGTCGSSLGVGVVFWGCLFFAFVGLLFNVTGLSFISSCLTMTTLA